MTGARVELDRVTRTFDVNGNMVRAVADVDLRVEPNEFCVIRGPSGSGKSTLIRLIACLDRPTTGRLLIDDEQVDNLGRRSRRALRRGRILTLLPSPYQNVLLPMTVRDNIRWVAHHAGRDIDPVRQHDLLDEFGLAALADRRCAELSGGEVQRVAIAACVAADPAVILLDEPTSALDLAAATAVVQALGRARDRGTTVIASSHEPVVAAAAEQLVTLERGCRVD